MKKKFNINHTPDLLGVNKPAKCGEVNCNNPAEVGYGRCKEHLSG